MRRLTSEERELLSVYIDREATPEQRAQAEKLLAASPEAQTWLEEVGRAEKLAHAAGRAGTGSVDLSRLTGRRIAAAATRRRLPGAFINGALLSILALGLLTAGFFLFQGESTVREGKAAARLVSRPFVSEPAAADLVASFLADVPPPSRRGVDEPVTGASTHPDPPADSRPKKQDESGVSVDQDVSATQTHEASPLHLSINLHHSSAKVIIGDDQWSDTLRFSDAEDQVIALSTRISTLTDSLNADVARIAADTSRSARDRADEILLRQMEYEAEVARELESLRKKIDVDDRDPFDGACIDTPAVTGLS